MVEDDFTFVSDCDNDKVGYEYFIWVKKKKSQILFLDKVLS